MLKNNAEINTKSNSSATQLHEASMSYHFKSCERVKLLLQNDAVILKIKIKKLPYLELQGLIIKGL